VENLVREIDDGGGYLGTQLDDLVGSPGGLPFSYLLAGWLSSAPTPAAEAAAGLMGHQPWEQAPSLVYPTAVLTLFVADAVQAGGGGAGTETGSLRLVSLAQTGLCSTLADYVSGALDFIFESLKVNADTDSFLGWLGTIWNAALDLARWAVEGLIELLTAPIITAITDALAIVGALNMVASLLKPWSLEVTPSNTETRFAVGDESDIAEAFVAEVDTGIEFDWPPWMEDCAQVAGLALPDPSSAEDSGVSWTTAGLPGLGEVTNNQNRIDSDNQADLNWVTGREASGGGDELSGTVSASVTVESKQLEEMKSMINGLIKGHVGDTVGGLISLLTDPIIDKLAELVQVNGASSVTVFFHDEEEEEEEVAEEEGLVDIQSDVIVFETSGGPPARFLKGTAEATVIDGLDLVYQSSATLILTYEGLLESDELELSSAQGQIRFSDGSEWRLSEAVSQAFCTLPGGCGCPTGSVGETRSAQAVSTGPAEIEIAGGPEVTVRQYSLEDYCNEELKGGRYTYILTGGNWQWNALGGADVRGCPWPSASASGEIVPDESNTIRIDTTTRPFTYSGFAATNASSGTLTLERCEGFHGSGEITYPAGGTWMTLDFDTPRLPFAGETITGTSTRGGHTSSWTLTFDDSQ
jgi:hypothetical protein